LSGIFIVNDSLLNIKAACTLLSVSRATFYRNVAAGLYPAPVKISTHRSGWRMSQLQALIQAGI
jgi:predicted DNA-binding transcriptional regulator AlpA